MTRPEVVAKEFKKYPKKTLRRRFLITHCAGE